MGGGGGGVNELMTPGNRAGGEKLQVKVVPGIHMSAEIVVVWQHYQLPFWSST